jgi:putative hydrolase of the HAD superfamily
VSALAAVFLDLDDTLLDTAGLLLRPARLEAGAAMVAAGWPGTAEEAATGLERLARDRPHDDPFHALAEERGADPFRAGVAGWGAFFKRNVPERLPLVTGAAEALATLRARGVTLVLVTFGDPPTQEAKIRATGLAPLVDEVRLEPLAASPDKARAFREICGRRGLDPARCAAVGDRPDAEIAAGRALGMRTVRVRRGEHVHREARGPLERADVTVPDFAAAAKLLLEWCG